MSLLQGVVNGTLRLVEVTEVPVTAQGLTSLDFIPNAQSTGPYFTMDDSLLNIPPFGTRAKSSFG